jgi:hypothetical protein
VGSNRSAITPPGRVLEPVVAPEQLLADCDRGHPEHAAFVRGVGGAPQRRLDLRILHRAFGRCTVEPHLRGRLDDATRNRQVGATLKRVAAGLHRKLATGAGRERERAHAHGLQVITRPGIGPAHRREAVGPGAALDLGHPRLAAAVVAQRPARATRQLEQASQQDGLPLDRLGQQGRKAFGGEIRVGRANVEVEGDGRHRRDHFRSLH